jgi:hypothetical protein
MIDPGIWDSEQVMSLTPSQFKLFIYLISQADDEGRLKKSIKMMRVHVHPCGGCSDAKLETDLRAIIDIGLVEEYGDNKQYLCHPNWKKYQSINHPTQSIIPPMSVECSCKDTV